jgi:hypothetical protein
MGGCDPSAFWKTAVPTRSLFGPLFRPSALSAAALAAALALPACAWAQAAGSASVPASAVQVSTDPARAAEVLRTAAELRQRPRTAPVAPVRAETAAGYKLLSGGVTAGDRTAMQAERAGYSLWVSTVAKPSGAYLADVDVQIERIGPKSAGSKAASTKTLVLQRQMEGPWLLVALPPGSYEVTGRFRDGAQAPVQTLSQRANIAKKGQREVMLRFNSAADVDSEASAAAAASSDAAAAAAAAASASLMKPVSRRP